MNELHDIHLNTHKKSLLFKVSFEVLNKIFEVGVVHKLHDTWIRGFKYPPSFRTIPRIIDFEAAL